MTPSITLKLIQLRRQDDTEQLFLHVLVTFPITKFMQSGHQVTALVDDAEAREVTVYIVPAENLPRLDVANPLSYLIHLGQVTPTNQADLPVTLAVKDAEGNLYGNAHISEGGVVLQDESTNDSKDGDEARVAIGGTLTQAESTSDSKDGNNALS